MATDPIRLAGGPSERAAGERVAELFEEHGRMVYGLCRLLLRDPVEADDATQSTFVSAFRSLLGGAAVREPAAWLSTIARNECRARSHARMREPLPLLDDDVAHVRGPHEEVKRRIAVAEIREAIAELPEKQREAVVLRDLYGLRYDEVGAALGLSRPSVEALLFRARRHLRVRLKPLAGGALAVPLAVREGIAQALPAVASSAPASGALAGGVTASAAGGGLLAKLAAAPAAAKIAAVVAVGAAGSAGVVEAEHATRHTVPLSAARHDTTSAATPPPARAAAGKLAGGNTGDGSPPATVSLARGGDATAAPRAVPGGGEDEGGAGVPARPGGHDGGDLHGAAPAAGGDDGTSKIERGNRTSDRTEKRTRESEHGEERESGAKTAGGMRTVTAGEQPRAGDDGSTEGHDEASETLEQPSSGDDEAEAEHGATANHESTDSSPAEPGDGEHEDAPEDHPVEVEPPE